MTARTGERVWYASYGSNLLRERFLRYVLGGEYGQHGTDHHGARNRSLPSSDRPHTVDHELRFGGESSRWGGGVAFLDPEPDSGRSLVRLWNLDLSQFADVAAQENGVAPGTLEVDLEHLRGAGYHDIGGEWYGRALWCGELEGLPVVTFTCPAVFDVTSPSAAYLSTVASGLLELHPLEAHDVVDYLLGAPGVEVGWTRATLLDLVRDVLADREGGATP